MQARNQRAATALLVLKGPTAAVTGHAVLSLAKTPTTRLNAADLSADRVMAAGPVAVSGTSTMKATIAILPAKRLVSYVSDPPRAMNCV